MTLKNESEGGTAGNVLFLFPSSPGLFNLIHQAQCFYWSTYASLWSVFRQLTAVPHYFLGSCFLNQQLLVFLKRIRRVMDPQLNLTVKLADSSWPDRS